jgi:hypothetical protein
MDLDDATALTELGDGRFEVDVREEYAIGGIKPNGGYLLACLGRAAIAATANTEVTQPFVVAAGVQFAGSPDLGPATIDTDVVRVGRTASQVAARLPGVSAQFTLATLTEDATPFWGEPPPVELPAIENCEPTLRVPLGDNGRELRFDPAAALRFTDKGPIGSGDGELRAWFRFTSERRITPLDLLYVVDCMPPPSFTIMFTGFVPTLDLTVYVRAIPAPGPLRIRFRAQMISQTFADEVCEVWDSAGRLVAQSTQLTALRLPTEV